MRCQGNLSDKNGFGAIPCFFLAFAVTARGMSPFKNLGRISLVVFLFRSRLLVPCLLFCASCVLWLCFSLPVGFPALARLSSVALLYRTVLCWSLHGNPCPCPAATILLTFFAHGCGGARCVSRSVAYRFRRSARGEASHLGSAPCSQDGASVPLPVSTDPDLMFSQCSCWPVTRPGARAPGFAAHKSSSLSRPSCSHRSPSRPCQQPVPRTPGLSLRPPGLTTLFPLSALSCSIYRRRLRSRSPCLPALAVSRPSQSSPRLCPIPNCPDHAPLPHLWVGFFPQHASSRGRPPCWSARRRRPPLGGFGRKISAFAKCVNVSSVCVSVGAASLVSLSPPSPHVFLLPPLPRVSQVSVLDPQVCLRRLDPMFDHISGRCCSSQGCPRLD